jgi:hypothetical protein
MPTETTATSLDNQKKILRAKNEWEQNDCRKEDARPFDNAQ